MRLYCLKMWRKKCVPVTPLVQSRCPTRGEKVRVRQAKETKYGPQIWLHEIERSHLRLGVVAPAGCDDEGRLLSDDQTLRPSVRVGKGPADTHNLVDPYRQEHLAVRGLRRKRLLRPSAPIAQLERANQEWSMDFVMDGLGTGRALRVLTVVDSYTRECLAMEVDSCLSSRRVTRALEWIIQQRGTPQAVRCDNGPEFPVAIFWRGARIARSG
jgi:Integrase core domain